MPRFAHAGRKAFFVARHRPRDHLVPDPVLLDQRLRAVGQLPSFDDLEGTIGVAFAERRISSRPAVWW